MSGTFRIAGLQGPSAIAGGLFLLGFLRVSTDFRPNSGSLAVHKYGICYIYGMATTLRLNETLFREAKAEAARSGMTLTRFIEDALRQKLGRKTTFANLPVFDSGIRLPEGVDYEAILKAEENAYALRVAEKLLIPPGTK
jgi:predicted DNA-binding ribbon-helix-helix protein